MYLSFHFVVSKRELNCLFYPGLQSFSTTYVMVSYYSKMTRTRMMSDTSGPRVWPRRSLSLPQHGSDTTRDLPLTLWGSKLHQNATLQKRIHSQHWKKAQNPEILVTCPGLSTKCIGRTARTRIQASESQPQCSALWYRLKYGSTEWP